MACSVSDKLIVDYDGLGLAYATSQGIHGLAILQLAQLEADLLTPNVSVIGGSFGFVMIAAMALTSNEASRRRLGPAHWKRLHGLGQLTLGVIYLVSYGGRAAENLAFAPHLSLLLAAFGLRLAARRR